jgi:hypothetical protein
MGGALQRDAIHFMVDKEVPAMQAVYIKAYDEIFTELNELDILKLLQNINRLAGNPTLQFYIDIPDDFKKKVLKKTHKYLGPNSAINKIIRQKLKTDFTLVDFKNNCSRLGIQIVYLGGVFGRSCVCRMQLEKWR